MIFYFTQQKTVKLFPEVRLTLALFTFFFLKFKLSTVKLATLHMSEKGFIGFLCSLWSLFSFGYLSAGEVSSSCNLSATN